MPKRARSVAVRALKVVAVLGGEGTDGAAEAGLPNRLQQRGVGAGVRARVDCKRQRQNSMVSPGSWRQGSILAGTTVARKAK